MKLRAALRIAPGEGSLVRMVLAYGVLLGLGRMFCASAISGLFLERFGAGALPYTFLGTALIVPITGLSYLRLQGRLPLARLILGTLAVLAGAMLLFWLALRAAASPPLVFGLMVGYTTVYVLITLIFWGLTGQLFDLRQGKRLFGLLGSGSEVGDIIGGTLTVILVPLLGAPNLLLLSAASFAGALLVVRRIVSTHTLSADKGRNADDAPSPGVAAALRGGFVRGMLLMLALSQLAYFFVETIFYALALEQFSSADQLSALVGATVAASSVLTILLQITLAGPWLARFGVRGGLAALPALLVLGATAVAIGGAVAGPTFAIFALMLATRVTERALRFSLDESAVQIAYQPIPAARRSLVQTVVDGGVRPLAAGLAGALILLATGPLGLSGVHLTIGLAVIAAAWLMVALGVGRGYSTALLQALGRRRLDGAGLQLRDAESLAIVRRGLRSPHAGEALYALQLLEELETPELAEDLRTLLAHPEPAVRQEALRRAAILPALAVDVGTLLKTERSPAVRGQALRTLGALRAVDASLLLVALDDPADELRLGAAAALAALGETEALLRWLRTHATAADEADRALAAQLLGAVELPGGSALLLPLLRDEAPAVRRAAVAAVPALGDPALWPEVVAALKQPATERAALASLAKGGVEAAPALEAAWVAAEPAIKRPMLARACGVAGAAAAGPLLGWLDDPAEPTRHAVALALEQSGLKATGVAAEAVRRQIDAEAAYAAWALAARRDVHPAGQDEPLRAALVGAARRARERVLALLHALVDSEALGRARAGLRHSDGEQQAYGVEALDLLLPASIRPQVLALVEPPDPEQTLAALERCFPQERLAPEQRRAAILAAAERHHPWLLACARFATGSDADELVVRVGLLKSGQIFAELPEEELLDVALLLRPEELPAHTPIFRQGDTADCAYIVAAGAVQIHDGERTLNRLAARDMFGELALLDGQPRALSATTLAPTALLRLEREALLGLLASHVGMARGVIRVLIRNLRVNLHELQRLDAAGG